MNGGKKLEFGIEIGCPQGSILSPFLWNILINKVLKTDNSNDCNIIAYADDLTAVATGRDIEDATAKLQILSRRIISLLKQIMLKINPKKSTFMLFKRKCNLAENNVVLTVEKRSQHHLTHIPISVSLWIKI